VNDKKKAIEICKKTDVCASNINDAVMVIESFKGVFDDV
jgi:hypothetical protein